MTHDHGVYVHIPWCRRRCPYCAFTVAPDRDVPWARFLGAVLREVRHRGAMFPGEARSVYLGGGTPSRMPIALLADLVRGIPTRDGAEVTAEANPEDIDAAWLSMARQAGINRISLGLQTFHPRYARLLNRASSVGRAAEIARVVANAGLRSWSVDLIFALPGQTLAELEADLEGVLATRPPHLALYGLTFEPGTPFERARARGRLTPPPDDLWREMYDRVVARLAEAGLERYEVSNFARPGHRSDHNLGYWSDRPYMGVGPSAHGFAPDGTRYVNDPDVSAYLDAETVHEVSERPDLRTAALDMLAGALRCSDGLDLEHLARRTGHAVPRAAIDALAGHGLVALAGSTLRLTGAGFPVADAVLARLASAVIPEGPG